jgi:hypothetical protein
LFPEHAANAKSAVKTINDFFISIYNFCDAKVSIGSQISYLTSPAKHLQQQFFSACLFRTDDEITGK